MGTGGHAAQRSLNPWQQRMRLKTTLAAMLLDAIPGIYVGSSPWVDFLNAEVPPGTSQWLAPGVTVPGVFIMTSLCIYFPLLAYLLRRKLIAVRALGFLAVLATALPLSIGLTAGTGALWVQYVGAAVGGAGLVAAQFIEKIVAIQWWALTGEASKGAAQMGGSVGLWSLAFTLLSAWLCHGIGLELGMYVLACIIFVATLYPLWLALAGELQAPALPAALTKEAQQASDGEGFSMGNVLGSLSFWQLFFHFTAFFYFGFGMKALLTPIFQVSYDLSYLKSASFAAIVLAFYAAVRSGLPLLTQHLSLLPIHVGLLAFSAALYACFPGIVANLPVECLVVASTLTGGSFAGLSTLRNLLALEMYGAADLANILPLLEVGVGLGKLIGPVLGYYIYLSASDDGVGGHSSYNMFFYSCAVVAAADALNMLVLHMRTRR